EGQLAGGVVLGEELLLAALPAPREDHGDVGPGVPAGSADHLVDVGVDVEALARAGDLAMAELEGGEPIDRAGAEVRKEDLGLGPSDELVRRYAPLALEPVVATPCRERSESRVPQQELGPSAIAVDGRLPRLERVEAATGLV